MTQITTKPSYGAIIALVKSGHVTEEFQNFFDELQEQLNLNLLGLQVQLTSYTVATLPVATTVAGMIFVSDETGGSIPAFSDGTNWRRVTDRAIVS